MFDLMETSRMAVLSILVAMQSAAAAQAELPDNWLVRTAEAIDEIRPTRLIVTVAREEAGRSLGAAGIRYLSDGSVSRFELRDGEFRDQTNVASLSNTELRRISGWAPGDEIKLPIAAGSKDFVHRRGSVALVDPGVESRLTAWPAGYGVTGSKPLAEVFATGQVSIAESNESIDVRLRTTTDPVFDGAMLSFDRGAVTSNLSGGRWTWPLRSMRWLGGSSAEWSEIGPAGDRELPALKVVKQSGATTTYRTEEVSFERSAEKIEAVEFLPGMLVTDERVGFDKRVIWSEEGPGEIIPVAGSETYNLRPARIPAADAINGRPANNRIFWLVNSLCVCGVVVLLFLRGRWS